MIISAVLALTAVFISALSQLLLKKKANKSAGNTIIQKILNLPVVISYAIFFIATLLNTFAYRKLPLKYANLFDATGFIWVTLISVIFLKEKITKKKMIAMCLIIAGVAVYSL